LRLRLLSFVSSFSGSKLVMPVALVRSSQLRFASRMEMEIRAGETGEY
jgi:hypothetical protein